MFSKLQWKRPVACRLCQCPVADTSVRIDKLNFEKLSEWWKQKLDAKLEQADVDNGWICQFCLWDSRFEHENSVCENQDLLQKESKCDWWDGFESNPIFFKHYYKDAVIKRCFVGVADGDKIIDTYIEKRITWNKQQTKCKANSETNCCYCQREFPSKKSAFNHVKEAHSNIDTFKCFECEILFENVEMKSDHYQKVHKGNFRCIYCENWECTNRMNLRRHMREKHQGEVIQCKYSSKCGLYFKTQEELQKHISKSHESDKSDKLQCVYCSKFVPKSHVVRHINTHHKSVAIKCDFAKFCSSYFFNKKDRHEHILEVHQPGISLEKFKCLCCHRVLVDFIKLKEHVKKAHSKRILKCSFLRCRFFCTNKLILKNHMQKQHAEFKNVTILYCSTCNFETYCKRSLQNHEHRIHGTENLKCQHCPKKSFKSKFSIECHVRLMHIFKTCRHCKTHLSLSALQNHNKVLKCQFCKFASPCMFSHRRHERKCTHWNSSQ